MEHRDYLRLEEEKRKRARVTKTAIVGPLIRWVSRREEVKVIIQPPAPAPPPPPSTTTSTSLPPTSYTNFAGPAFGYPYSYAYRPGSTYSDYLRYHQAYSQGLYAKSTSGTTDDAQAQSSMSQQVAPAIVQPASTPASSESRVTTVAPPSAATVVTQTQLGAIPQSQQPQPIEKLETVAKNYVIHELDQNEGVRKANWTETMKAMFGEHVRWDEVKVYVGKGRPMCTFKFLT